MTTDTDSKTTTTDEDIVRAFLEKFSDDPYKTSEAEAAFNRLMQNYVWEKITTPEQFSRSGWEDEAANYWRCCWDQACAERDKLMEALREIAAWRSQEQTKKALLSVFSEEQIAELSNSTGRESVTEGETGRKGGYPIDLLPQCKIQATSIGQNP